MANAAVTAEVHETLDVHRRLAAQIAFDGELADLFAQAIQLAISEFLDLGRTLDADRVANLLCTGAANAVDRGQSDLCVLVIRNVNACYTSHVLTCSSPLVNTVWWASIKNGTENYI